MGRKPKNPSKLWKHLNDICHEYGYKSANDFLKNKLHFGGGTIQKLINGELVSYDARQKIALKLDLHFETEHLFSALECGIVIHWLRQLVAMDEEKNMNSYYLLLLNKANISRESWEKWLSNEEEIPKKAIDTISNCLFLDKNIITSYKFLHKSNTGVFFEYFRHKIWDLKDKAINHALSSKENHIIINNSGRLHIYSGDELTVKHALKLMEAIELKPNEKLTQSKELRDWIIETRSLESTRRYDTQDLVF